MAPSMDFQAPEQPPLHLVFFPFLTPSHMFPMLETARITAERGVKVTLITTPANAHIIQPTIDCTNSKPVSPHQPPMELRLIPFPSTDFGLPDGCESIAALPANSLVPNFFTAAFSLIGALDTLLRDLRPVDALVSDANHVWTTAVAAEHGIPCLIFQVTGLFRGQGRPRRLAGQSSPAAAGDGCRPMAAGRPGEGRPCHQAAGCGVRKKAGEKMQRGRREKRRRGPAAAADGAGPVVAVVPTSARAASGAGRLAGGGPAVRPGSRPWWLATAREE